MFISNRVLMVTFRTAENVVFFVVTRFFETLADIERGLANRAEGILAVIP
ncbi:MAG TPA: hypothetical protein VJ023_19875 [Pyrinomonadaceae bacterium]|nr:hypothetical protein [Pyrinomonadaceae bacterium]